MLWVHKPQQVFPQLFYLLHFVYIPLADTSPEYWPCTWQTALGSRTTLIPTPFSDFSGVFPIVRDIKYMNTVYMCLPSDKRHEAQ